MRIKVSWFFAVLFFARSADAQSDSLVRGIGEVVITGNNAAIRRSESVIPMELLSKELFRKNPTPSLFDAIGLVNGVQPQLNCNVCNTGDIHINGMEGPYTMVLIDGMPIVSNLSTVYGLSGIPTGMIERIELVKGPASALYGSEAMGGLINVITKSPGNAPRFAADLTYTSWQESTLDLSSAFSAGKKWRGLLAGNAYHFQKPIDKNGDGFTDLTLQKRASVFTKWTRQRTENREASIALRYVAEDRWGGETRWTPAFRGGDSIYAEQIETRRWEAIAQYRLPLRESIMLNASWNLHRQNSVYGTMPFVAAQQVFFGQAYWQKEVHHRHKLLAGAAWRYTDYNDNTPATADAGGKDLPSRRPLPGAFLQDEWQLQAKHKLLLGHRTDFDKDHGFIHSPRLAWKFTADDRHTLRASFGSGFRVVNVFTEDHAALSGARTLVFAEALRPEKSLNGNVNYLWQLIGKRMFTTLDASVFYTRFSNKIIGDFDTDPQKIIYRNLRGVAVSRGISVNADLNFSSPLKMSLGASYMDVFYETESGGQLHRTRQLHAPCWTGNFLITYSLKRKWIIDLTGKVNGPMRLPVVPNDFRPEYAPWFCIANVQLTYKGIRRFEVYGGLKNLLNFVPKDPILRPFDPFDKQANDPVSNPNNYTFDPSYNYSSLQGIRGFFGVRYTL